MVASFSTWWRSSTNYNANFAELLAIMETHWARLIVTTLSLGRSFVE